MSTETDGQGRLYLPKHVRETYGDRYHIVTYEDRVELVPVAEDPLAAAREAAGELREADPEAVREAADTAGRAEAADTDP